jgi:hypothetical protein
MRSSRSDRNVGCAAGNCSPAGGGARLRVSNKMGRPESRMLMVLPRQALLCHQCSDPRNTKAAMF